MGGGLPISRLLQNWGETAEAVMGEMMKSENCLLCPSLESPLEVPGRKCFRESETNAKEWGRRKG